MIPKYEELRRGILGGHLGPSDANVPSVLLAEVELLRELADDLIVKVKNAPCIAARPGELTYHCAPDKVCRVCEWRDSVDEMLHDEWSMSDGLWSSTDELSNIKKREGK